MEEGPQEPRSGRSQPASPGGDALALTEHDLYLFREGTHRRLFDKLGSHLTTVDGVPGTRFAVWAPHARGVSVFGSFNDWDATRHAMRCRDEAGIWELFVPDVGEGATYKYHIISQHEPHRGDKADPFAFYSEEPPRRASRVWDLAYRWQDEAWVAQRAERQSLRSPLAIYEVHLGSWRKPDGDEERFPTYRELAPRLAEHVLDMGFTHVELLPVMEHPFYGSWGYQITGFFAPTSRYGTPQDLMYLIDHLHQNGIGVILDWVPSHFPTDGHGLAFFDGTHLFEHADPRRGYHPDWGTFIFDYGREEVRSFLLSSAFFWLELYHADGLRVDAVASMLYLDYSRREGEWIPNRFGGRENLEAVSFLQHLNDEVHEVHPGVLVIAEESTAWPLVTDSPGGGGLGFDLKWDLGWMNDTLEYLALDPIARKHEHQLLTFRALYARSESFILPLSHDEVVHGKGSLVNKMPGDAEHKLASLRLLLAYLYLLPGKTLLFMGAELGQWHEWDHDGQLQWHLLDDPRHAGLQRWVRDLNRLYVREKILAEGDFESRGFEWVDCHDAERSVIGFLRSCESSDALLLAVLSFTPVLRPSHRIGIPRAGTWREVLNSDALCYGGRGYGNLGAVRSEPVPTHGRPYSVELTLPPLGALVLAGPPGSDERSRDETLPEEQEAERQDEVGEEGEVDGDSGMLVSG